MKIKIRQNGIFIPRYPISFASEIEAAGAILIEDGYNGLIEGFLIPREGAKEIASKIFEVIMVGMKKAYGEEFQIAESYSAASTSVGSGAYKEAKTIVWRWSADYPRIIINPFECWDVRDSSSPSMFEKINYLLKVLDEPGLPEQITVVDRYRNVKNYVLSNITWTTWKIKEFPEVNVEKRVRQVRDVLNKCKDQARIEECAKILGV